MKVRVAEAAPIAKRIGSMKVDTSRRVRALKSKVLSKALSGVEATQLPDGTVKQLQAATLAAAGRFRTRRRSPALASYATELPGLDVRIEITKRRARFFLKR